MSKHMQASVEPITKVDAANAGAAWGSADVSNWYKNDQGRVTANLPFRIIDYWRMTKNPSPEDYIFKP